MQIGDATLDLVYNKAIAPAIEEAGLSARRVDKHNEGGLLKSEIVKFIQDARIVVADLTNERPNVYLEVGYSMGLDRFRHLILTSRENHFPDSPNYVRGGPRIQFDLAGYDILKWEDTKLEEFRTELVQRIRRRLALTVQPELAPPKPAIDAEWIREQRTAVGDGFAQMGGPVAWMEVVAAVDAPKPERTLAELNDAAEKAPIHTFGWPIAVYLHPDAVRPKPRADGISATILSKRESFDYWAIRRNTDFYFAGSLFEDQRKEGALFFDTRIIRVTEALMYVLRLYGLLGIPREQMVTVRIHHVGLKGRTITAANGNRSVFPNSTSETNESETEVRTTLDDLEARLPEHVRAVVEPLFELFDFKRFETGIIYQITNDFVQGRIR